MFAVRNCPALSLTAMHRHSNHSPATFDPIHVQEIAKDVWFLKCRASDPEEPVGIIHIHAILMVSSSAVPSPPDPPAVY